MTSYHRVTTPPRGSLPISRLLPLGTWWHHRAMRTPTIGAFAAMVVTPPAAMVLSRGDKDAATVVFAVYFAAAWFLLLRVLLRPRIPASMFAVVVAVAVLFQVPFATWFEELFAPATSDNLLAMTFGVAAPEELAKLVPVAALVLVSSRARTVLTPRSILFLGLVSGVVFGVAESIVYVVDSSNDALTDVWRLVTNPLTHGCWAGVSAYFLGLAVTRSAACVRVRLATFGLGVPIVLHGVDDWSPVTGSLVWAALAVVSALLFLAYGLVGVEPTPYASPAMAVPRSAPTADPVTERIALPAPGTFVGPDGRLWG